MPITDALNYLANVHRTPTTLSHGAEDTLVVVRADRHGPHAAQCLTGKANMNYTHTHLSVKAQLR